MLIIYSVKYSRMHPNTSHWIASIINLTPLMSCSQKPDVLLKSYLCRLYHCSVFQWSVQRWMDTWISVKSQDQI